AMAHKFTTEGDAQYPVEFPGKRLTGVWRQAVGGESLLRHQGFLGNIVLCLCARFWLPRSARGSFPYRLEIERHRPFPDLAPQHEPVLAGRAKVNPRIDAG